VEVVQFVKDQDMQSELKTPAIASDVREVSRQEFRGRLNDTSLTIVDVLPAESYAAGHIPGALSLPLQSIASRAPDLLPDRSAEIIVYCGKFT
jgi:rhodanese-related sulfurtransferase